MKKFILFFCFVLLASQISAQVLEENFDYPAGDSLGAHDWISFSGNAPVVNRLLVTSPGLVYAGYGLSGIGNATTLATNGQDAYKAFSSNLTSGSVYASMMVNVDTARTGDYFAALLPSTSTTNFTARTYVKLATNGNLAFGISKAAIGTGPIVYGDSIYTTGITYLLVSKYTFNTGTTTDDSVSLFIFSSGIPATEPTPNVGPVGGTSTDSPDLGRFALRQGTAALAANIRVDGILVSTSWTQVLPVELASFTSIVNRRDVTLNWTTTSERNNLGFEIERSLVSSQWTKVGFVPGNGNTTSPTHYSFIDRGLNSGKYNYRLKQIDFNGNYEYFNLINEVNIGIPDKFDLSQNYPNPFNPSTKINYDIPFDGKVSLRLYDISGKEVATLVNDVQAAGYYTIDFNATNLSSGIYFYTLTANNFVITKKLTLVK